jgi:NAD(P)H-dependent FMN reductase
MKILAFAGSLRKESLNLKLVRVAAGLAAKAGHDVAVAELAEYQIPLYDGDVETASGLPAGAARLAAAVKQADAIVISAPEYNASVSGVLKNAVDWISRDKSDPLEGKPVLLLSASPSMAGGNRGLWHLRVPLEACGAFVNPEMYSLAQANKEIDAAGNLVNPKRLESLTGLVNAFLKTAGLLTKAD